jgi:acyl-CoA reductase-like NAD-dependent aldehyde dehydrogenase
LPLGVVAAICPFNFPAMSELQVTKRCMFSHTL